MQFIEPWATLEAQVDLAAAWGSVPLSVVGLATSLIESELGSGEATVYYLKVTIICRYIFADLGFCAFYWYQILLLLATLGAHAQRGPICIGRPCSHLCSVNASEVTQRAFMGST